MSGRFDETEQIAHRHRRTMLWRVVLGACCVAGIAYWGLNYFVVTSNHPKPKRFPLDVVLQFTTDQLAKEWSAGRFAQGFDVRVGVTGTILRFASIRDGSTQHAGVVLATKGKSGPELLCVFNRNEEPWRTMRPGQTASLAGRLACDGTYRLCDAEAVIIEGASLCAIRSVDNYVKTRNASAAPSDNSWVQLEGRLADVRRSQSDSDAVILEFSASNGSSVRCQFMATAPRQCTPADRGREVAILGRHDPKREFDLIDCVRVDELATELQPTDVGHEPAFRLTVSELKDAYETGQAAERYGNRWVEVTGQVVALQQQKTGEEITSVIVLGSREGDSLRDNISCEFLEEEPWLKAKPGQTVKITGLMDGSLRSCEIVEATGEPYPIFTVERLLNSARDQQMDGTQLTSLMKFSLIEGVVDEIIPSPRKGIQPTVKLKSEDSVVSCYFLQDAPRQPTQNDIGKTILVFAEFAGSPRRIELGMALRVDSKPSP